MITDQEARRIACDWHGGGGTALYALCSTGAILTGDRDTRGELAEEQLAAALDPYTPDTDMEELKALREYVKHKGTRVPVDGWGSMPWEDRNDPGV